MTWFDKNMKALPENWKCPNIKSREEFEYFDDGDIMDIIKVEDRPCVFNLVKLKLDKCEKCGVYFQY